MTESMKTFLAKVSADKALAEKAAKLDKDALIALAKDLGIELTEDDFSAKNDVSEDELAAIHGGHDQQDWASFNNCPGKNGVQDCFCAAGGGGKQDENGDICACVGYGQGYRGGSKCICPLAGLGQDDDV